MPVISGWKEILSSGRSPEGGQLVSSRTEVGRDARTRSLPDGLHRDLVEALRQNGIECLYLHQEEAYRRSLSSHIIVTTGPASGKSLCFNLPVLNALLNDPDARALYLYPTKALAQDQARHLAALSSGAFSQAIYDGDTPSSERPAIRKKTNLVLTNPDMLHIGTLPHHQLWGDFLANLRAVVVDEAHVYRGIFGSHVANVLRRLRRLARLYGAEPRFILTSATIANPIQLAEGLCGLPFELIDEDASARMEREIVIWNPPLIDERSGTRRSALSEAADLFTRLVASGVRAICFTRSRRGTELIYKFSRVRLRDEDNEVAERIAPYRGGYTPQQRREIEHRLATGQLLGVVATNALELGIDIGQLEAAICVTFPGTVASLRQQWGRAGRSAKGLAIYVAGEDALDQFFARHPEEFLDRPVEAAILEHQSESVYLRHLVAASFEAPLTEQDRDILGDDFELFADRLVEQEELRRHRGRYLPRRADFPAAGISLRSASTDNFGVVERESGELLGTVEAERAFDTVHPGAVYMHLGESYEVTALEIEARRAIVARFSGDYYTQPKKETEILIEETRTTRNATGTELSFGIVAVSEQVIAFQKKRLVDHEVLDLRTLDLPEQNFITQALWYVLTKEQLGELPLQALLGSLHAVEHAQIAVLPLLAMCDRWDIGGLSTNYHHQTGEPTIFIYDGHPGGVGIAKQGYRSFERLAADARRLIAECSCQSGCPSCVQSPKCGNLNEPLDKLGALELLGTSKGLSQ